MVSIFKVIRENNVQVLNQLIGLATGEVPITHYNNDYLSKQELVHLQQQLKYTGLKLLDLNKRSAKGRTALHVAASWNRVEIAQLLINCPLVNVNLQDRENGWTALHRIGKDLERLKLYDSTIPDAFPEIRMLSKDKKNIERTETEDDAGLYNVLNKECHLSAGGTDVYTWGQNTNYVLGHPDSENRSRPERVHFQLDSQQNPAVLKRPAYVIESVVMAKYHMAILTSESTRNLLVCGFGRGGRLGLGKEIDTQLVPIPVPWPERIMSVALGRDHTIAVTESGVVISFGSNEFGQLGYEIESDNKKDEVPMQLTPKKIQAQSLKKQSIVGAAASRIHSVVYNAFDLFTFGLNQGQLGYYQSDNNESCQTTPRKISMPIEIKQVIANDNATVILNKAHEVILLCNYTQQKLFFQFNRFPSDTQVDKPAASYITKLISSGTEYLGALTNIGDVFVWTCKSQTKNNKTIVTTPKRVWTSGKAHMAAVDASLGQYGEIVICTVSGHVFLGRPENSRYKFKEMPYIQRCIRVCANSSGAFAAIRAEYLLHPTEVGPSTLKYDISQSLPHMIISEELQRKLNDLNRQMEEAILNIPVEDEENRNKHQMLIRQRYEELTNMAVESAWELIEEKSRKDKALDTVFVIRNRHVYCHSSILACRSQIFKRLAKMVDKSIGSFNVRLTKRQDNRIEVHIDNCELGSLLLMIDYIYTDEYEHPMKVFFCSPVLSGEADVRKIQKDLVTLAELFHLPHLLASAQSSFNHQPTPSFLSSLDGLVGQHHPNVVLKVKDKEILCHEVILRQRCVFFKHLLSPQSTWVAQRREQQDEMIEVDLEHMSSEVAETIVQYLYLDKSSSSLFDHIEKGTEEAMLYFLLDLLCEADALLLNRLKLIVENAIVQFIKLRTASTILEHADVYWANSLKHTCLSFVRANLSAFLSSRMLDHLPVSLILELEEHVRQSQSKEIPLVPRGNFNSTNVIDTAEIEDDEFSTSLYALSRGDGSSAGAFTELLVTLYPEKSSSTIELEIKKEKEPDELTDKSPTKTKKSVRIPLHELVESAAQPVTPSYNWVSSTENILGSKPSLRDILEEEHQTIDGASKSPKSTALKKVSQKERKKLNLQLQEPSSSQAAKPVWGKISPAPAKPFRKTMAEDEQQMIVDKKGKKIYVSEEELLSTPRETKPIMKEKEIIYNPVESISSTFQLTPIRRQVKGSSNQPGSSSAVQSFQTIQKQQLEDHWLKNARPKKNLLRIQKEEQAIAGLEQYYIQTLNVMSGEWCHVQRVTSSRK